MTYQTYKKLLENTLRELPEKWRQFEEAYMEAKKDEILAIGGDQEAMNRVRQRAANYAYIIEKLRGAGL